MDRQVVVIIFTIIFSLNLTAQETNIKSEVEDLMYGNCHKNANLETLMTDAKKSVKLLSKYKSDTLKCYEKKVYETTCQLFYQTNDETILSYIIDYTLDSNNSYCGYLVNCIYDRVHLVNLSSSDIQKLTNPKLSLCDSRSVPLLLSYLDLKSMIPTLKDWGLSHQLSNYDKIILSVSLARLGDEKEVANLINREIKTDAEWLTYFDYLNYIRKTESTEKLISFLSNDEEIILEEIPDAYIINKCKLSSLALYHLSMFIEDFPYKIDYMDLYEDMSEKTMAAQKWFTENKDYRISTALGRFKL